MKYPVQILHKKASRWEEMASWDLLIQDAVYRIDTFFQVKEGVIALTTIAPTLDCVINIMREHNRCGNFLGCHVERANEFQT
jgi:hypothetical protein